MISMRSSTDRTENSHEGMLRINRKLAVQPLKSGCILWCGRSNLVEREMYKYGLWPKISHQYVHIPAS